MIKKILIPVALLAGLFCASALAQEIAEGETQTQAPAADAAPFTDVGQGDTNYVAIKYLKENRLVNGYEDGTFRPLQEVNRAEALKMLSMAVPGPRTTNPESFSFADVESDDWFYPYVLEAWNNYLVKGYPDGLFHPEKTINIAESLKIALTQEGNPIPPAPTEPPYGDVPVDAWFAPYAAAAKDRTLILESRKQGALYPENVMNRGSFAELLYRLIKTGCGSSFARATWYSDSLAAQSTANRELYIPTNLTAAHKTLPFNTKLLVTNLANGKSVEVRINDRGPYATGVDLDLSRSAFEAIASAGAGIINVEYIVKADDKEADPETISYGF